jgi:hypothetical protein
MKTSETSSVPFAMFERHKKSIHIAATLLLLLKAAMTSSVPFVTRHLRERIFSQTT